MTACSPLTIVPFCKTLLRVAHVILASILLAEIFPPSAAVGQSLLFRFPFRESAGGIPVAFDLADVDQDQTIDAVVAVADGTASVFLNERNDGELIRCSRETSLSGTPSAVLLGQFDSDTVTDLVIADTGNHRLQSLIGMRTGSGCNNLSFSAVPGAAIATHLNPAALGSAFFDKDDQADLVVASRGPETGSGALMILRGEGGGSFTVVPQPDPGGGSADLLTTGNDTRDVAIADLDGDGAEDLLAVNAGDDSLLTFLGNGDAEFALASARETGRAPFSVATATLDADRNVDAVIADRNDDTVSVFLGVGDGTFLQRSAYPTGIFPEGVATADLNGDGFADVVTANRGSFDVSILLGDGSGGLSSPRSFVAEEEPVAVLLADLGGNDAGPGQVDVVAITANGTLTSLMNRGDGTLSAVENIAVGDAPSGVAVADLDDDALPDLLVAGQGGMVSTFLARSSGGFQAGEALAVGGDPLGIVAVDLDRDERIDFAVADQELDRVAVAFGIGGGRFTSFQFQPTAPQPVAIAAGDFDHDGRIDLAVAAGDEDGRVSVLLQEQPRQFLAARNTVVGREPIALAAGKFDTDDYDDLAVANNASATVTILQSNGDGSFRQGQVLTSNQIPANPVSLALGDFDADGLDDLAVGGVGTLGISVVVSFGNGDGTFEPLRGLPLGQVGRALVARDFTGDQVADLAAVNQANQLVVAISLGTRQFRTRTADRVSRMPIAVSAGDFDGDGRYDAVTANNAATSQNLSVLWNCARDPGCGDSSAFPGTAALRGDANGDGRRSAADLTAVAAEALDGDGRRVERIGFAGFTATPGVDANGDGRIDAQDRIATLRHVFAPSENAGG